MRRVAAILVAVLAVCCAVWAQEGPDLRLSVKPDTVMIGEVFEATVTFTLSEGRTAIVPGEDAKFEGAEVRSFREDVTDLPEGGRRHSATWTLVVWEVGERTLQSPAIAVRDAGDEVTEFGPAEATLTVRSVLPEGATEIKDIRPPREIPLLWYHYALAALPVLGLLGLVALLVWWLRSRRSGQEAGEEVAAPLPPAEEALLALRELEAEDLVGEGRIKEHYVRLSWILRNYVERRWGLPALEETTGMLAYTMAGSGRLGDGVTAEITQVLRRADLAKFAKHRPEAPVARADIDEVREIVRSTRREEAPEAASADAAAVSPAT
jgi:hypothetical protein